MTPQYFFLASRLIARRRCASMALLIFRYWNVHICTLPNAQMTHGTLGIGYLDFLTVLIKILSEKITCIAYIVNNFCLIRLDHFMCIGDI